MAEVYLLVVQAGAYEESEFVVDGAWATREGAERRATELGFHARDPYAALRPDATYRDRQLVLTWRDRAYAYGEGREGMPGWVARLHAQDDEWGEAIATITRMEVRA